MSTVKHVLGAFRFIRQLKLLSEFVLLIHLVERVKADCPVALHHKVDLSDVGLFLVKVAILICILKQARHEAESYLVQEIGVKFFAHLKEAFECGVGADDVLEEEFAHDVLLDLEWNRVEVSLSSQQNCCSIIVPEVSEVSLNPLP